VSLSDDKFTLFSYLCVLAQHRLETPEFAPPHHYLPLSSWYMVAADLRGTALPLSSELLAGSTEVSNPGLPCTQRRKAVCVIQYLSHQIWLLPSCVPALPYGTCR
jgi:hypothetical protein